MNASLQELQIKFSDFLLDEQQDMSKLAGLLRQGGALTAQDRLGIYHRAYRWRLIEALQDSFEHTWAYLGDAGFAQAAAAYIEKSPSTQANIRWYGAGFSNYLAEVYPKDLEIAELAALDWALRLAFDAADACTVGVEALRDIPDHSWGQVKCTVHPSVQLLQQAHNTLAIWRAIDEAQTPPVASVNPKCVDVLVWRREARPHYMSWGAKQARALQQMQSGLAFADVCASFAHEPSVGQELSPNAAQEIGAFLRQCLELGLICNMHGVGADN